MKKQQRVLTVVLSCLTAMAMLTSCGASPTADSYKNSESTPAVNYDVMAEAEGGYISSNTVGAGSEPIAVTEESYYSEGDKSITGEFEKKIIKTADVYMSAKSADEAYNMLIAFLNGNGGYEFTRETIKRGDYVVINATLKVVPEKFDAVIDYTESCGKIQSISIFADDITSQYYDTQIRLENKRKNLEKYYELLEDAYSMDDIIKLQNQVDMITADIEAAEGQLRMWSSLVSESTINVCIQEEADPNQVVVEEEVDWNAITPSTMLKLMGNGFKTVCNTIVSVFQWLVIVIVTISPLLAIVAVIVILAKLTSKKRKAKKAAKKEKLAAQSEAAYKSAQQSIKTEQPENKPQGDSADKK